MSTPTKTLLSRLRAQVARILEALPRPRNKKELAAHLGLAMVADPSMEPVDGESDRWRPAETFTVAEFVNEECEARGWSVEDLARAAGWGADFTRTILAGGVPIGAAEADGLSKAFGTGPEIWLRLYASEVRAAALAPGLLASGVGRGQ